MLSERHERWIADARIDLEAARLLSQHMIPHYAIFHARQAVEKLLKAGYPILQMRSVDLTLEEIFLQLTTDEAVERRVS